MKKILFLSTHMGGGVGKALSAFINYLKENEKDFEVELFLTEAPLKTNSLENINFTLSDDIEVLKESIEKSDLVVLNWWHNPKMASMLNSFPAVPTRLIIWHHISGCSYPVISAGFAKLPHKNLFTTKYSYENKFWTDEERKEIIEKSDVVYGQGKFEAKASVKAEKTGFTMGYIGTLSYNKLHPDFVYYCKSVEDIVDNIVMVGDYKEDEKEAIIEIAKKLNIESKFEFISFTPNVAKEYAKFDFLAYLLNHNHFGTTENVLLEAMDYEVPVVTLDQNTEKYIFKHLETGLLVNNISEFKTYVEYLYNNPEERLRLTRNAKKFYLEEYEYTKNAEKFLRAINETLELEKRVFDFKSVFGEEPYQWFMECLGKEKEYFANSISNICENNDSIINEFYIKNSDPILKGTSKSSIPHFLSYYEDKVLEYWNSLF